MSRIPRWLWFLLADLPALGPFLIIRFYGVDLHYGDEWAPDWAGFFISLHSHHFAFTDLIAQHNEHREFVPRLFLLLLDPWIHWDAMAGLFFQWIFACAASLALLQMIWKTSGPIGAPGQSQNKSATARTFVLWFLCNLLFFSPSKYEIWLSGMGLANQAPTYLAMFAFMIIRSSWQTWIKLTVAFVLASAATFSQGNGALALPLCAILLAWAPTWKEFRAQRTSLFAWIAACAVMIGLYFVRFTWPPPDPAAAKYATFGTHLAYAMAFLGSPLAYLTAQPSTVIAVTMGSVMFAAYLAAIVLFVIWWRKSRRDACDRALVWLVMGGYSVLSALLATRFRAILGVEQAYTSRYITHAMFLPIALINLVPIATDQWESRPRPAVRCALFCRFGLAGAFLVLYAMTIPYSVTESAIYHMNLRRARAAFLLADIFPGDPVLSDIVSKTPLIMIEQANALDRYGYWSPPLIHCPDAERIRQSDPSRAHDIEGQLLGMSMDRDGRLTVGGWAMDNRTKHLVDAVFLTYRDPMGQSRMFAIARLNVNLDVLVPDKGEAYRWSGWIAPYSIDDLPPTGKIYIKAWAFDSDTGQAYPLRGICLLQRPVGTGLSEMPDRSNTAQPSGLPDRASSPE